MESVDVRNLDQIQETDGPRSSSRLATLFLASLGGAALVAVGVVSLKRSEPPARSTQDPLAALVDKAKAGEQTPPESIDKDEVTFPAVLSDHEAPTTALAAVEDERGRLVDQTAAEAPAPDEPPPPADQLPVVPLPAGTLLNATPVTTEPKDDLSRLASEVSKADGDPETVMPGAEGGYQLQVASFKKQEDADALVVELRKRGHRAYRQAAHVPERGLWHRVRIGPFKNKYQAKLYQDDFEKAEQMSTFLVDPDAVERKRQVRAAKLAARMKKYGRP